MKPEAQRIAIAEECGWKLHERHVGKDIPLHLQCWTNGKDECFGNYLPDYLNDLNACHEMEKCLNGNHQKIANYQDNLIRVMGINGFGPFGTIENWLLHATAAQRCEAFLRTIGKWTEEKG